MAELISQSTVALDSGGVSGGKLYRNTTPDDLLLLRNEAAQWSFGRPLTREEVELLLINEVRTIPPIDLTRPLILQKDPRIALVRTPSGITRETFGKETIGVEEGKLARVSYLSSRPISARVTVELIETWPQV